MAYRNIEKRKAWFKNRYRRRHDWELERAARYRRANPEARRARQRSYSERMMAADPTWRVKTHLQASWKGRLRRKGIYHSKGFLELLGTPWPEFAARLERQRKRRGWDWERFRREILD